MKQLRAVVDEQGGDRGSDESFYVCLMIGSKELMRTRMQSGKEAWKRATTINRLLQAERE